MYVILSISLVIQLESSKVPNKNIQGSLSKNKKDIQGSSPLRSLILSFKILNYQKESLSHFLLPFFMFLFRYTQIVKIIKINMNQSSKYT